MKAKVSLVGVGPGNLEDISLKAMQSIKQADVILYDNLIPDSILNYAKIEAELIYVGKQDSRHHLSQDEINELLYEKSKIYKKVLRLKGGDTYIFGRGAEEVEFLKSRGVDVEVFSGISSFYAAPASLGIPITHRDYASSFHVFTGHEKANKDLYIDYELVARLGGTLVFMMSLNNIAKIVGDLLKAGKDKSTRLSIISRGTSIDEERYDFSLGEILEHLENKSFDFSKIKKPALMVLGDVANLDLRSNEFFAKRESRLFAKNILLTGTRNFCARLSEPLKSLVANPISLSLIEVLKKDNNDILNYINKIKDFTHIVFTSANGVEIFFSYIKNIDFDIRNLAHLKFVVLGEGTNKRLKEEGIKADFIPSSYNVDCLAKELLASLDNESKVLVFRASLGSKILNEVFDKNRVYYKDIALYDTLIDYRRKDELSRVIKKIDYVVVASGSAAKALNELLSIEDRDYIADKIISIGEYSTKTLESYGFKVLVTASESSIAGIVSSIKNIK